ncbi:hypothetical protein [Burkholderia pyrrocinia]|uniref:hypothetical protein n=1 Tax=Burkholderia pyrrocinia TaxID=60550 RepID=UPI00105148D0|nr:hypothetical protein [Burkholderia pyrrocinia]TDA42815.1 hypothetical protein EVG18_35475 [Burkholderia pyrrocinia]
MKILATTSHPERMARLYAAPLPLLAPNDAMQERPRKRFGASMFPPARSGAEPRPENRARSLNNSHYLPLID